MAPLGPSRPLFDSRWQSRLAPSVERAMVASVQFYDPNTGQAVYNPGTGQYTTTPTVLYSGEARVQPIRSANERGDTQVQTVLVSIPIASGLGFDLRPQHRGRVTACALNPLLLNFVYTVKEVLDSSNPIERTFQFSVDQEAVNA